MARPQRNNMLEVTAAFWSAALTTSRASTFRSSDARRIAL